MRWVLLFVLGLSLVNAISLESPPDSLETMNDTVLFSWTGYNRSFDSYVLSLYGPDYKVLDKFETTDRYMRLQGLEPGQYSWDVGVVLAESVIEKSNRSSLSILESQEEFVVDVDTSGFEGDGSIILFIDAPMGSEVDLSIKGPGQPIEYKAWELKSRELKTYILEPGRYQVEATASKGDWTDSYKDHFNVGEPTRISSTEDNSSDAGQVKWNLSVKTVSGNKTLGGVQLSYEMDGETDFSSTDENGILELELEPGTYSMNFYKTGYYNKEKIVELDSDVNLTIGLAEIVDQDTEAKDMVRKTDLGITLLTPENNSKVEEEGVDFAFAVGESGLDCQLLLNEESNPGWEVMEQEPVDNIFTLDSLPMGIYKARIKCSKGSTYDYSGITYFTAGNAVKREDLVGERLSQLDRLKKEIGGYEHFTKLATERLGFLQAISQAQSELKEINSEYNQDLQANQPEKDTFLARIDSALSEVPESIEFSEPKSKVVYLPSIGFDNLLADYFKADLELSSGEKEKLRKELKTLQELLLLDINVQYMQVRYHNGLQEAVTLVDKSLDGLKDISDKGYPQDIEGYDYLEQIPYDEEIGFYGKSELITERLYRVALSDDGHIRYYVDAEVPMDLVKESTTIVMPGEKDVAESPEITGLSIADSPLSGIFSSVKTIVIYVLLFGFVLVAGSVFIPGTPGNRLIQKDPSKQMSEYLKLLLDHMESNGIDKSIKHFPKALDLYEAVPTESKEEYRPMIQYLAGCLEKHALGIELDKLMVSLRFQQNLMAFDPNLYEESASRFNDILNRYNSLHESFKSDLHNRVCEASQALGDIRNKYK